MFKKGDRIHLHDGVYTMPADGIPPRAGRRKKSTSSEAPTIRGFVRGALVGPDGVEQLGDWHENTVTVSGHAQIISNFAGMAGSAAAKYWGIGSNAATATTALAAATRMDSEYGTNPASAANAGGALRADVGASQAVVGTYTLSQSWAYPSNQISNNVVLNCLAQYASSAISTNGAAPALSLAVFASSSKSNSQALNITYNWSFGT